MRTNDLILGMFLSKMHREQIEIERMKMQAAQITEAEAATLAKLRAGTHCVVEKRLITDLAGELDASDGYAAQENPTRCPSVWQIKNGLLRETVNAMLAATEAGDV